MSLDNIKDARSLFIEASRLHDRVNRMSVKPDGTTRADPLAITALLNAAVSLDAIDSTSRSAQGVVFIQKMDEFLEGGRPLTQTQALSATGYIKSRAKLHL